MGELIDGDDGLPAEIVGPWAKEKHDYLCRYVQISSATRKKYLGPSKGGAAYIDLYCGPGRSLIRETNEMVDGSAVAAWKRSVSAGSPFSKVIVGDADHKRLNGTIQRLVALRAPVVGIEGAASDTALRAIQAAAGGGLNFAFLDPYSLGVLDFETIRTLSRLQRVDILVHVSAMDLQRNLGANLANEQVAFDVFAPGWRSNIDIDQSQHRIRQDVFAYWQTLISGLGVWPSAEIKLITGTKNQPLYWLLLAARHELAHKFWETAANRDGQGKLF